MKVKVYQSEDNEYIELESLGKLKYKGESFGVDGLTDNKIYDCVGMSSDGEMLSIVDDSEENYMYSSSNPRTADGSSKGGVWEIYEIYDKNLKELLSTQKQSAFIILFYEQSAIDMFLIGKNVYLIKILQ